MLNLREYAAPRTLLADYLPWACLVAPGVVLNKDGSFQTTFKYRGPDLESSTEEELVSIHARVNNVLRRFGSGWALFFEAQRAPVQDYRECDFPNAASWLVDQERGLQADEAGARYESHYYLTLLWLPPADAAGHAEKALITRAEIEEAAGWRHRLETFQSQTARVFDLLATCLAELARLDDDGTLTYLHTTISTRRHPVVTPDLPVFLDAILADEPFAGGLEPMIGDAHLRTLTILGFPASTLPGMLDELNRQGFAYRWATRFIAMDKAEAEKILARKRRHWFAKRKSIGAVLRETLFNEQAALVDNDADNKAADADAALQELGSDLVSYGYATTTITVVDEDRRAVDEHICVAERIINGRGFTAIRETLNVVEAWLGSLPGHPYANVRKPILHTLNLAHMVPLSAVWAGEQTNRHLNAPALIQAQTHGTTPFRLNLHIGDVGHTLVVGPTGAGKSVLLSLLAMQWKRYTGAQVFVFDKGRSARAATLAMGGSHVDLGSADRPSLQPLKDVDSHHGAGFAADWLAGLCMNEGVAITPDLKAGLWDAIQSLASAPRPERTLTGLSLMLQDETLKAALHPFTLEGPHGRLLDADHETLNLADTVCFEMEELMHAKGAVAPVITYLFHRLEERFDGRPTLLILDEAWLFLDDPMFAARIREWLKTLRKKNVSVVFATQSLADIAGSTIAPALVESCPTRIFLPNERAQEPQSRETYQRFGLNTRQIELISRATPKRDYYYQSPLGCRVFELGLGPIALALCGASAPEDHQILDRVWAETEGDSFTECWLIEKGLPWAADLLHRWPGQNSIVHEPLIPSHAVAAE
ncbi:MAG TPA: conjugal transfer protein TrbE [Hyphomonas sp.]|uniref:conjugal transfer protein TrbE n=1 Tax=Hyphomonas sp. UBA5107 TaxID=1946636 RepID=UPI000C51320B|nr:conjugal transfer protein TrbE [Hyphomonas sp. UBA5107]MAA94105.1 conjugal transfer protein TrbE [Rheinheimera sp.]MAN65871.1 conjugal transfer protein TrbE [Hyphomonadaceae bacterium]HCJ17681.1 conjugal transfer protein TrbE [Hyphomonas sp.]HCN93054.1 conjugal transfer protein TrbE [Hyphomonas sp.]|tara:strand:- start:500 stop:2965 length:2466 start_codon:yes stop_codon:yes gene_type:complete